MTTFTYWVLLVFIAYFAVLIGISVIRVRRMDNMSDYVLGGRRMGVVTSALSAASSSSSGWTMLVFPALAFAAGLIHLWTAASIAFGDNGETLRVEIEPGYSPPRLHAERGSYQHPVSCAGWP